MYQKTWDDQFQFCEAKKSLWKRQTCSSKTYLESCGKAIRYWKTLIQILGNIIWIDSVINSGDEKRWTNYLRFCIQVSVLYTFLQWCKFFFFWCQIILQKRKKIKSQWLRQSFKFLMGHTLRQGLPSMLFVSSDGLRQMGHCLRWSLPSTAFQWGDGLILPSTRTLYYRVNSLPFPGNPL